METKVQAAATEMPARDPKRVARDVIHRCNNFLSLLVVHGENALLMKDASAMEAALRAILEETKSLEEELRRNRKILGD